MRCFFGEREVLCRQLIHKQLVLRPRNCRSITMDLLAPLRWKVGGKGNEYKGEMAKSKEKENIRCKCFKKQF